MLQKKYTQYLNISSQQNQKNHAGTFIVSRDISVKVHSPIGALIHLMIWWTFHSFLHVVSRPRFIKTRSLSRACSKKSVRGTISQSAEEISKLEYRFPKLSKSAKLLENVLASQKECLCQLHMPLENKYSTLMPTRTRNCFYKKLNIKKDEKANDQLQQLEKEKFLLDIG